MTTSIEDADRLIKHDLQDQQDGKRENRTATISCPDCGGTLWQINEQGEAVLFQCHVGHKYSPDALLIGISDEIEMVLWRAVRAMVERSIFCRQLAGQLREQDTPDAKQAASLEQQAKEDDEHVALIREQIFKLKRRAKGTEANEG